MPVIQNVSVPCGDTIELTFNMDDDAPVLLDGATIYWRVFKQANGIPYGDPVLQKNSDGDGIVIPGSPDDIFNVYLGPDDTRTLGDDGGPMQGNYYHEAFVKDVNSEKITVTVGVFTVEPTLISSVS